MIVCCVLSCFFLKVQGEMRSGARSIMCNFYKYIDDHVVRYKDGTVGECASACNINKYIIGNVIET